VRAVRSESNPLIVVDPEDAGIGDNVNGPSLIRVPDWIEAPLGRYYLYFAHHRDTFIRLAFADRPEGPWQVYAPGALRLEDSACFDHVASPDAYIDPARREIRLYYHGVVHHPDDESDPHANAIDVTRPFVQRTFWARSTDGLHFASGRDLCGPSYFRVIEARGAIFALAMPGLLYRSPDGLRGWERGPQILPDTTRHHALWLRGDTLHVFFTRAGDRPERILHTTVDTRPDWRRWRVGEEQVVLEPEEPWEGADMPLVASERGQVMERVRQLRDPCIFEDEGRLHLVYAIAGEQGLALAQIELD
jgi:hypothetical protein